MKINIVRGVLSFVSVLVLIILVRPAVSEHYESLFLKGKKEGAAIAAAVTSENAGYNRALGAVYLERHGDSDLKTAEALFKKAISLEPLNSDSWLWLARMYQWTGRQQQAGLAIKSALARSAGAPDITWDAGVLLLQMDYTAAGVEQFRKYILLKPAEQQKVYDICITLGLPPDYMQANLVPAERPYLLQWLYFLMDAGQQEAAGRAWEALKSLGGGAGKGPSEGDYLKYCDFLISKNNETDAIAVWNELFSRANLVLKPGSIWDGDFGLPVTGKGFGWRIGNAPGVRIFLDGDIKMRGQYSLSASFDGSSNPGINLASQIVPVEKGHKYEVSGYIKTSGITTDNGIFLNVQGYNCADLQASSQTMTGTSYWQKQSVDFTVPADCNAILFSVRRNESFKLDNKIRGDVWIDSIKMADQG